MRKVMLLLVAAGAAVSAALVGAGPAAARTRVFVGATFGGFYGPGYGYYAPAPAYYSPYYVVPYGYGPEPYYYTPPPPPPPPRVVVVPPAPVAEAPVVDRSYCREYTTTITIAGREREAYGRACMQPDGSWQRVTDPVPVPD